ncbi:MAG: alpha/beta fold hydrolase [Vulcanimicrobiaceae bacterium]
MRCCKRFGKDKVAIYGHSWGSALGVLYAARFPEKVAAYVGTGQIGDWPASELLSYVFVLAEAERRKNRKALNELRAIRAPPHTAGRMMVQPQMAHALRRHRARNVVVEVPPNYSRRAGIVDLRSAQHCARQPIFCKRHVG